MFRSHHTPHKIPGESGVDIIFEILKTVLEEEQMTEEWESSEIVSIFKQKVHPLECEHFWRHKAAETWDEVFGEHNETQTRSMICNFA